MRAVFESIFHTGFPLKHPHWLKSSRGGRLELDGYSAELKLAFEYQGFRHYRERNRFAAHFASVKRRDEEKAASCAEHGIMLIPIDEMPPNAVYDPLAVFQHVAGALHRHGIETPPHLAVTICSPRSLSGLERLKGAATRLNLELIDEEYRGVDHHYHWRCGFCHRIFSGSGYYRLIDRGCPLCWRARRAEGTCWRSRKSRRVNVGE